MAASWLGRLSAYGWARRGTLAAAALVGSAAFVYAAHVAKRHALWEVVRLCALDQSATGSPFPCLKATPDYIILRPPFGLPDTILSPTRRIVGLEDPFLQRPEAPNYFALAFAERRWLGACAEDGEGVGLVVNSRLARSQDQLHVHLGRLRPDFAARLAAAPAAAGAWRRAADIAPGLEFWTYRLGPKADAASPFRLLHDLVGDAEAMRRTLLGLFFVKGEFVVVALRSRPGGWYSAAEDVIDADCQ